MGNIKFLNGEEQTAELQEKAEIRLDEPPAADRKEEQAAHVLFEDISKREVDAKHFSHERRILPRGLLRQSPCIIMTRTRENTSASTIR